MTYSEKTPGLPCHLKAGIPRRCRLTCRGWVLASPDHTCPYARMLGVCDQGQVENWQCLWPMAFLRKSKTRSP